MSDKSDNPRPDNPPPHPGRPDHPDFWRMAEIMRRLDRTVVEHGQSAFNDAIGKFIDRNVLAYTAEQRALRALLATATALEGRSISQDDVLRLATAVWVDGAIMMATFERERDQPSPQPTIKS